MSKVEDIDWNEAPTDTAVWIVQNDDSYGTGWYYLERGLYINFVTGDAFHELSSRITVCERLEQEPAEWMPNVGEECELKYKHSSAAEWFPFKLIASDEGVMFGWTENDPTNVKFVDYEFRPLRTEDEKKREAFHLKAFEATEVGMTFKEITDALFDAGCEFTMPEGEG